jgi:hypothetical protein
MRINAGVGDATYAYPATYFALDVEIEVAKAKKAAGMK